MLLIPSFVYCRHPLDRNHHVTVMKVMLLRSQETMSGRKEYIVLGTTFVCSEDAASIGKVDSYIVIGISTAYFLLPYGI